VTYGEKLMLALSLWSGIRTATSPSAFNQRGRTASLAVLALALAACNGGAPNGSNVDQGPPPAPNPSPQPTGTVVVQAITTSGAPISGVDVSICSVTCPRAVTDANGEARFEDISADRSAGISLSSPGYYRAYRQLVVAADSATTLPVTLVHVAEATPVLLAAHPTYSSDGRTLALDIDVTVLDASGAPWQTLSASDFKGGGSCDGWYACWIDIDGNSTPYRFDATVVDASFTPVPNTSRPAMAAAVLLDQSARMASFDPDALRLQAVGTFFDSIISPDTVALGSYRSLPGTPILTTYGGFTSDATVLDAALIALAGQESGTNPFDVGIADMIAFAADNAAAGGSDQRRSIIAVMADSQNPDGWGYVDCGDLDCSQVRSAAVENARAAGISVFAMGPDNFPASLVALQTGGAIARVQDPTQFPVVFRALNSIIGHNIAFNRLRIEMNANQPGVFAPGRTVVFELAVRVAVGSDIYWELTVPI
jgi:hypothetical protein